MRILLRSVTAGLLLTLVASAGLVFFGTRALPGVRAAGIPVGGLSPDGIARALGPVAQSFTALPVIVRGDGREWIATNAALGIALDVDRLVFEAYGAGRGDGMLGLARGLVTSAGREVDLGWPRRATGDDLHDFLETIAADVDRAPVDGLVAIGPDGVGIVEPAEGAELDAARLRARILADRTAVAVVTFEPDAVGPALDAAAIADARSAAAAAYAPLTVRAGSERLDLEAGRVASVVRIEPASGPEGVRLAARIDDEAIAALVDEVAGVLDGPARDAVLVPGGERLEVVDGRDGVAVDRAAARGVLADAIFASGTARDVALPAVVEPARLSTAAAAELAASVSLAGGYTTYFPVSPARATNIGLGAAAFDGLVIAPGERFSFWARIGEVSRRTGYVDAGCIVGGVSSSAIGGGLCQVSTTLFNAVARAGVRIDERHQHSYYIERYPVGMDAAVFAPTADLKWTNDTGVPLIVRSASTSTSVSFWIYGAPTGRSVVLPEPLQRNFRYPAATQPADPAHAPGYVVPGRDVWATRVVYEDGAELWTDVWYSHYAPVWGGPAR